jgi:N-acetyl-alpha-D-glucosaminyl L-malate synthase BshA
VAAELGKQLAKRGHTVHFVSYRLPFRLADFHENIAFHEIDVSSYVLFEYPPHDLALAAKMAEVSREHSLDLLHVHYAIPHAIAGLLAQQMLGRDAPRLITTLHGTDITLVGSDPSYARVVAFSIDRSHGVTAVSHSLRSDTITALGIQREIRVVPNFLDCAEYRRRFNPELRARLCPPDACDAVVLHVSNFRPVKRVDVALEVVRLIRRRVRARFLLIGDGPVRGAIERLAAEQGMSEDVVFLGEQQDLVPWLSIADLFLLPSAQESFGLAALEAMACEVPVIASNVGGLPEIIQDGVTGFLHPPEAVEAMAERGVALLSDADRRATMGRSASHMVRTRYCAERVVPMYEAVYHDVLQTSEVQYEA